MGFDLVHRSDVRYREQLFGQLDAQKLPTNVYRFDKSGRATVVAGDINRPDGLAFSPDESKRSTS